MTSTLQSTLEKHPFLEGIRPDLMALLAGCAKNRRFEAGEYLTREDEEADRFFLVRNGRVALRVRGAREGALTILTVGPGEMVGWSWMVAPHRYRFDAQRRLRDEELFTQLLDQHAGQIDRVVHQHE